ncbi:YhjD/YihY/BrkB family envelope integrity protein [Streptomyces griseorubiginosus]
MDEQAENTAPESPRGGAPAVLGRRHQAHLQGTAGRRTGRPRARVDVLRRPVPVPRPAGAGVAAGAGVPAGADAPAGGGGPARDGQAPRHHRRPHPGPGPRHPAGRGDPARRQHPPAASSPRRRGSPAGFALYAAHLGSCNKTYGTLTGAIVFLGWLWLTDLAILLGLEFDAELTLGAGDRLRRARAGGGALRGAAGHPDLAGETAGLPGAGDRRDCGPPGRGRSDGGSGAPQQRSSPSACPADGELRSD